VLYSLAVVPSPDALGQSASPGSLDRDVSSSRQPARCSVTRWFEDDYDGGYLQLTG